MSKNKRANPDVVIVQLCLPHYRVPFFEELSNRSDGKLQIFAGAHSFGGSPVSVRNTPNLRRISLINCFLPGRVAIQYPLPGCVFDDSIVVLEFNPRILSNLWILIRQTFRDMPVILWGHGLSPRITSPQWVKRLRKWMADQASAVIFYSEKGKRDFIRFGVPQEKLFVAYNAIDVRKIMKVMKGRHVARKHLLFVGRLIKEKKPALLVEAFARAANRLSPGTRLVMIGSGPEKSRLLALAEAARVAAHVDFLGEITDEEELADYFSQSALGVSPGPVGLFAIHTLAYGIPVLTCSGENHGPEAELLKDKRNSFFFRSDDAQALAERIVSLMAKPDKLAEMGRLGQREVIRKYSIQRMADVFIEAFKYVLRSKSRHQVHSV